MKLYVVHDQIANEDVCCFFMQNVDTLRRSFADCLEDVKNGQGKKPAFLRDGFSLYEFVQGSDLDWEFVKETKILDLLPELRKNED